MKYPLSSEAGAPINFAAGAVPPFEHQLAGAAAKSGKLSHDTVSGCRENARFDTAQAGKMGTSNARSKYELSAASWTARGDMLQRFQENQEARVAASISSKTNY
jgi:hypothetical protein